MAIAKHKTRRHELREGRALARRVQRGDRQAFELLYASYEGRLYRLCHRLTGSDAAAAALVEAAFARGIMAIPQSGFDAVDVPAHLAATARRLAYERRTTGGVTWLDPVAGEHASEVAAANQRLAPRQRIALALRDLEGRPDDEIATALGTEPALVAALVARARLRLLAELGVPSSMDGCREKVPALSAYADGTLAAEPRAGLEAHVADCPGCRAGLFALREATRRYRALPVPVPPGELRSRITIALGSTGFPTRQARALVPDPPPASNGRPTLAAATMAALVLIGALVTFAASRDVWGSSAPAQARSQAPPPSPPAAPSGDAATPPAAGEGSSLAVPVTPVAPSVPPAPSAPAALPAPPAVPHLRTGPLRVAPTVPARTPPPDAGTSAFAAPPPSATPPPPPAKPPSLPAPPPEIPVEILPPLSSLHAPASAEPPAPPAAPRAAPPEAPPEALDPPVPAQTTTT